MEWYENPILLEEEKKEGFVAKIWGFIKKIFEKIAGWFKKFFNFITGRSKKKGQANDAIVARVKKLEAQLSRGEAGLSKAGSDLEAAKKRYSKLLKLNTASFEKHKLNYKDAEQKSYQLRDLKLFVDGIQRDIAELKKDPYTNNRNLDIMSEVEEEFKTLQNEIKNAWSNNDESVSDMYEKQKLIQTHIRSLNRSIERLQKQLKVEDITDQDEANLNQYKKDVRTLKKGIHVKGTDMKISFNNTLHEYMYAGLAEVEGYGGRARKQGNLDSILSAHDKAIDSMEEFIKIIDSDPVGDPSKVESNIEDYKKEISEYQKFLEETKNEELSGRDVSQYDFNSDLMMKFKNNNRTLDIRVQRISKRSEKTLNKSIDVLNRKKSSVDSDLANRLSKISTMFSDINSNFISIYNKHNDLSSGLLIHINNMISAVDVGIGKAKRRKMV